MLKRRHVLARTHDKKSRFLVRSRIREDGVVSNFFAIGFPPAEPPAPPGTPPRPGTHVYVYEVYVTRESAPPMAKARGGAAPPRKPVSAPAADPTERRVPLGRAWRAVERFLRHRYSGVMAAALPPLVQVNNKVYAAAPLPAEALVLPRTYLDLGWKVAELRLQRRCRFAELPPGELQIVMNKIVPEVAHAAHREERKCANSATGFLEVVRERTGKMLCTMQGVSAGGLRVYRGVLVQAVFVDAAAADTTAPTAGADRPEAAPAAATPSAAGVARSAGTAEPACPVTSRSLGDAPVGLSSAAAPPTRFEVLAFLRAFAYRGTEAESYRIRDASGVFLASLWAPATPRALTVGAVYDAAPVRIREFAERGNARLIELLPETKLTMVAAAPQRASPARRLASPAPSTTATPRLPGQLSLKIDTKGTLAAEVSLWEEVLQHFGPGPYHEAAQQRIRKSVHGVPVVLAYSLRQGIVRDVRFDTDALLAAATATRALAGSDAPGVPASSTAARGHGEGQAAKGAAPMMGDGASSSAAGSLLCVREPRLRALLPHLDATQPCAILTDHTVVPLQVLHCCYDPRMRGWQDIGVAVLSLMPEQRSELLSNIQGLLEPGLRRWGLTLEKEALRTKALSLLPAPMKSVAPPPSRHQHGGAAWGTAASHAASDFPTTMLIIGVAGPRCTAEQAKRTTLTAQHLAQYFRTPLVTCVADESAAVQYVHEQLVGPAAAPGARLSLKDPNASVVLVTSEHDTRATRWLQVECMCRGAHFLAAAPAANPKRLSLMSSQLRRRIATQFELDPLRGIDLRAEVPVLGQRNVLFIGVDSCHTNTHSIGCIVGILSTPRQNRVLSYFWRHDARGREAQHVAEHFRGVLAGAIALAGRVDEVVVFQDGDVFSELVGMKDELVAQTPQCGLTFMCLHKRCNVRFMHASPTRGGDAGADSSSSGDGDGADDDDGEERHGEDGFSGVGRFHNMVKGVVVPALTTVPLDHELAAPSFYLQAHESAMSTARAVAYTVHHVSPTLDVADVQQLANVMANVLAPEATKLPMSTRCAHRLAAQAERLLDAVPQLTAETIPAPLCHRLWYL